MQIKNAAPLIYTRRKHIGFPEGLLVQPEDFSTGTAKKFLGYALDAMESSAELRGSHQYARAVVAEDGYIVLGIMAYLRDIAEDGWEGKDAGSRPIFGFFGYVWHRDGFAGGAGFPALGEFAPLLDTWIRPRWEDRHEEALPPGRYVYTVDMPEALPLGGYAPGRFAEPEEADKLIQWAMGQACAGAGVSACTNADVLAEADFRTRYQYVSKLRKTPRPAAVRKTEVQPRQAEPVAVRETAARPAKGANPGAACCLLAALLLAGGWVLFHTVLPGIALLLVGVGLLAFSGRKKEGAPPVAPLPEQEAPPLPKPAARKPPAKKESTEDIFKL